MAEPTPDAPDPDSLSPALTRWMIGGTAAGTAPEPWVQALGPEPGEAELRLLALTGHYLGAMVVAEPPGALTFRPDLPRLSRPPVPDGARPRVRRLLAQWKDEAERRALLELVDARGWTLHPGDWLPGPNAQAPAAYAPWQDWSASGAAAQAEVLTMETWGDFPPAARRAALADLRRADPAQAAALLEARIGGEGADERLRLAEIVAASLGSGDRPLLERLAADRAPRPRSLAAELLARLDGVNAHPDAAELAAFWPVQMKGLLRRARRIVPLDLRTAAQHNRRAALMAEVPLGALAAALGMDEAELLAAWTWGDETRDHQFAASIARTASDALAVAAAEAAIENGAFPALRWLAPRIGPALRRRAAHRMLGAGASFTAALGVSGGGAGLDGLIRTNAGTALLKKVGDDDQSDEVGRELLALGLTASRAAAREALDALSAAGRTASDPQTDALRLNVALPENSVEERG